MQKARYGEWYPIIKVIKVVIKLKIWICNAKIASVDRVPGGQIQA